MHPCLFDPNVMGPSSSACLLPSYLAYLLISRGLWDLADKSTIPQINNKHINPIYFPIPPLEEQEQIVRTIVARTSAIDDLITRKQRLIELLDEKRAALISRAVTQGLDANTPMKDSGVAWLGRVPAHWVVTPLKFAAEIQNGITVGKKYDDQVLAPRPYLRVANVQDGYLDLENITSIQLPERDVEQYELQPGDVVATEGGDFDKLARGYVWSGEIAGCLHQNHIFAIRPNRSKLRSSFLSALMTSLYGRNYFTATSVQSTNLACTNRSKLGAFAIPLPRGRGAGNDLPTP